MSTVKKSFRRLPLKGSQAARLTLFVASLVLQIMAHKGDTMIAIRMALAGEVGGE